MKYVPKLLIHIFIVFFACLQAAAAGPQVLVVHSYHPQYDWVQGINQTLTTMLEEADIGYEIIYMDTKRNPSLQFKVKAELEVRKKIEDLRPEVVVAVDDNAVNFGVRSYIGLDWPQIVFCGYNGDGSNFYQPGQNITGVFERTYAKQALDLLSNFLPEKKQVAVISDSSETGYQVTKRLLVNKNAGELPLELVGMHKVETFDEWKSLVLRYESDSKVGSFLIPVYHTLRREHTGTVIPASEIMHWTVKSITKPVIGLWPFAPYDGAVAAVVVEPGEHGYLAAQMVKTILSGVSAGDIATVENKEGGVLFNVKSAEQLGIEVDWDFLQSCDKIIE